MPNGAKLRSPTKELPTKFVMWTFTIFMWVPSVYALQHRQQEQRHQQRHRWRWLCIIFVLSISIIKKLSNVWRYFSTMLQCISRSLFYLYAKWLTLIASFPCFGRATTATFYVLCVCSWTVNKYWNSLFWRCCGCTLLTCLNYRWLRCDYILYLNAMRISMYNCKWHSHIEPMFFRRMKKTEFKYVFMIIHCGIMIIIINYLCKSNYSNLIFFFFFSKQMESLVAKLIETSNLKLL